MVLKVEKLKVEHMNKGADSCKKSKLFDFPDKCQLGISLLTTSNKYVISMVSTMKHSVKQILLVQKELMSRKFILFEWYVSNANLVTQGHDTEADPFNSQFV